MAKKEFQAESKKLMDMMINSIYTNKEIFLRELISNASDAIDKLYYKSLTDTSVGMNKSDFRILITRDKENRILTVEDNGIGMTKAELEENLGTIAHSGSLDFKQDNKDENIDIIGQFGVGFYSSFMVADKVTVISKLGRGLAVGVLRCGRLRDDPRREGHCWYPDHPAHQARHRDRPLRQLPG
jgi:molecular chaperone HtpG